MAKCETCGGAMLTEQPHRHHKQVACDQCGSRQEVKLYSPDMDITPVPLCVVCWFELGAARKRDVDDDG